MASAPAEGTPTLELRDVSKAFGPVIALRSGSLTLHPGSIHALVGERGRQVHLGQDHRRPLSPRLRDFRVGGPTRRLQVHGRVQSGRHRCHLSGTNPVPGPFGDREHLHGAAASGAIRPGRPKAMRNEVRELMTRLGVKIDPDRPAEGLSIADQQIIEIAKAISLDAKSSDHGRAHGCAVRCRGRGFCGRSQPARRGSRSAVHLSSLR